MARDYSWFTNSLPAIAAFILQKLKQSAQLRVQLAEIDSSRHGRSKLLINDKKKVCLLLRCWLNSQRTKQARFFVLLEISNLHAHFAETRSVSFGKLIVFNIYKSKFARRNWQFFLKGFRSFVFSNFNLQW